MLLDDILRPRPSRATSLAVSAGLVAVWTLVRLVVFDAAAFPLTYALPLLVCIWTRDRAALWSMAGIFWGLHLMQLVSMTSNRLLLPADAWINLAATTLNVLLAAFAVHAIIGLRTRLENALMDVHAQADELRAQREELAQQNEELTEQAEELSRQATELTQQTEELASQNEELQTQSEEIGSLNAALERRERLLEKLLETSRSMGGAEVAALHHIARAAVELFGDACAAAAVYEMKADGLGLQAVATVAGIQYVPEHQGTQHPFATLVFEENRTAALNDVRLRPDLAVPGVSQLIPVEAVLGTPIRFGDQPVGVFLVCSTGTQDWTQEQFRLAEWLADQSGRALESMRVRVELQAADQRKSEFLATLSHELRNPLAPMRYALTLIEHGDTHNANAVRVMERQFQQLVRLVDDLLDATRLSSNKIQLRKTRVDLIAIARQVIEAAQPEIDAAGHVLSVVLPSTPVWLDADEDRIAQVVTNLLNNACRYTPRGGQLMVTAMSSGDKAVLTVADTGIGLHPEDLARVFDMFTQVGGPGSGGLGIGLAIVRGIVQLHGGQIDVHSAGAGHGSQFRVTLPLAASAQAHEEPASDRDVFDPQPPRRVLVVDDNLDSAAMMADLLEMNGHQIWVAHDADAALTLANQYGPDVALLDIGLPGTDGYELARRLRRDPATQGMRLIAVTGWGQDGDRERARDAGFDAHLTKPADPRAILGALSVTASTAST
jgi:signal transduction histidine kinase/ActR/RegA family two-component response regulator